MCWSHYLAGELANCRIIIHCDNQAVVSMVNKLASSCDKCMKFLCILMLNNLIHNRRISVIYIKSSEDILSDALSRMDFKHFKKFGVSMNERHDNIPDCIKSVEKIFCM